MKVSNLNGTSKPKYSCRCGSWLRHWHNYSGQMANQCRAAGCSSTAAVGAHVKKTMGNDTSWYIVPFCHAHNRMGNAIELVFGTELVPANQSETCGLR
ncbi:hypothetical protein [Carboxylicivirga sp. M1479]|uniref:hypothetical protein n=1 Tax=Carboxylicivirga sp. M1479 TaxID=2594476 RepID=UPI001177871C|nr:hypothetical protein [Carboxylicivirga sp. M1479]TRX66400.1 hypothetical protein FNN09_13620 [Carboxylicivirga sp. M1479]